MKTIKLILKYPKLNVQHARATLVRNQKDLLEARIGRKWSEIEWRSLKYFERIWDFACEDDGKEML